MNTTTNMTIDRIVRGIAVVVHSWEVCVEEWPDTIENIQESANRTGPWQDWASIDFEVAEDAMGLADVELTDNDHAAWEGAIQMAAQAWLAARRE